MSEFSNASNRSVNFRGEEITLDIALDTTFLDLQRFLNQLHCSVRSLASNPDQDDDLNIQVQLSLDINDSIDDLNLIFKELQKTVKQMIDVPKDQQARVKELIEKHNENRKRELKDKKDKLKQLKELSNIKE